MSAPVHLRQGGVGLEVCVLGGRRGERVLEHPLRLAESALYVSHPLPVVGADVAVRAVMAGRDQGEQGTVPDDLVQNG